MAEGPLAGKRALIGVIGGSGFYKMPGLSYIEAIEVDTPYGSPSDPIILGTLADQPVAFLPRHGAGHRILPSELPARANIYAFKLLGVEFIIGVSAVGSLREHIEPLHLVVPEQIIDMTRGRQSTFFGDGLVAHIAFAEPFCPALSNVLTSAAAEAGAVVHKNGTLVVMEGPAFSTRAESDLYRAWGADIIGMTTLPEAKLAREAEICYAALACATDYDCWREEQETVSAEMIIANLLKNVEVSQKAVALAVNRLPFERVCACANALQNALVTPLDIVSAETLRRLGPLIDRYVIGSGQTLAAGVEEG